MSILDCTEDAWMIVLSEMFDIRRYMNSIWKATSSTLDAHMQVDLFLSELQYYVLY